MLQMQSVSLLPTPRRIYPIKFLFEMQFANGDFMTRSNNVETVCRRVNPDDWDGDGECRV